MWRRGDKHEGDRVINGNWSSDASGFVQTRFGPTPENPASCRSTLRAKTAEKINDEADKENEPEAAAAISRAAIVKAAAAEKDDENNNEEE